MVHLRTICRRKISQSGQELKNQVGVGVSSVHPKSPPMKRGGKNIHYERNENYKSSK